MPDCLQWFLCLFVNVLPAATLLRVWDVMLWEGPSVLLRAGAALLHCYREAVLATTDFHTISQARVSSGWGRRRTGYVDGGGGTGGGVRVLLLLPLPHTFPVNAGAPTRRLAPYPQADHPPPPQLVQRLGHDLWHADGLLTTMYNKDRMASRAQQKLALRHVHKERGQQRQALEVEEVRDLEVRLGRIGGRGAPCPYTAPPCPHTHLPAHTRTSLPTRAPPFPPLLAHCDDPPTPPTPPMRTGADAFLVCNGRNGSVTGADAFLGR